jgi:hypothetical protein
VSNRHVSRVNCYLIHKQVRNPPPAGRPDDGQRTGSESRRRESCESFSLSVIGRIDVEPELNARRARCLVIPEE